MLSFPEIMLHVRPLIGVIAITGIGILATLLMFFALVLKMVKNYILLKS